jgi:putative transposase
MARSPRLFFPGAVYHVYCRTARGEMVFSDPLEVTEFVDTIGDVKRLHGFFVLAWCLMGNHYHLVIRTQDVPLWRSMARIQCRVARGHNRRRRVLGRLWQSRYKARVVRDDGYFKQLLAYVHLNPVAAGLVEDPAAYPWSGHAALIGKRPPRLVDAHAALRGFGEGVVGAREVYLEQVRAVAEVRWLDSGVRNLPWWENVSNDDQFIESKDADNAVDYRGELVPFSSKGRIALNQAVTLVCNATGFTVDALRGRSRSTEIALARKAFAILAVHYLGHSVADVAMILQKHPGSVSRWLETPRGTQDNTELFSEILESKPGLDADSTGM